MEEITPLEQSKSVLVLSLLVKPGECGELVLPSLPRLVRRTKEREELLVNRVAQTLIVICCCDTQTAANDGYISTAC